MAEYIEREALLKELGKHFNMVDGRTLYHPSMSLAMHDVRNAPAADVQPVVHSRWVHDERMLAVCLECGMTAVEDGTDYCPNCGAKMDLEEET